MRRVRLLLLCAMPLLGNALSANTIRNGPQILETAIELIKSTDKRNMEDFDELQKGITRVLEREGEDIFSILERTRYTLLSKIKSDIKTLQETALTNYTNKNTNEYAELNNLLSVMLEARDLLSDTTGSKHNLLKNFFSDRYILNIMKQHNREVVAAKVALIYILQHISQEHVLNLKALKVSQPLVIKNKKAKAALKKIALYDHEGDLLYIPNSGYSIEGESSITHFKGTNAAGFAELCLFGNNLPEKFEIKHFIKAWKNLKEQRNVSKDNYTESQVLFLMLALKAQDQAQNPSELEPGDFIVTPSEIMIVEETPNSLESISVIYNTRKDSNLSPSNKEGIVAVKIALPKENVWILKPRMGANSI